MGVGWPLPGWSESPALLGAGLKSGDVVLSVNRQRVDNLEDLEKALNRVDDRVLLQIRRGQGVFYLVLR